MIPLRATYRFQFHKDFGFDQALALLPYLKALGVSHAYASPVFQARPGSTHGYDVTDPTVINPELGGEAAFRRFATALREAGMGLILDIVPNHMATHHANPYWMDSLARGAAAPRVFDIDWDKPKILLPVLGETLSKTLADGQIALSLDAANGWLLASAYGEHHWPLRPEDTAALLAQAGLEQAASLWRLVKLPDSDLGPARQALRELAPAQQEALAAVLRAADLPALIANQHWRPVHWRSARDALTHRRFFNITELIGLRVEDPMVFGIVHRLPLALLREGLVDGLRIDHIDGLADPAGYCRDLRAATGPDALIVVEKILGRGEVVRPDWPIDGTTGYERLNEINGLFIDHDGYARLTAHLAATAGVTGAPQDRLAAAKRQVLEASFGNEVEQLTALAAGLLQNEEFAPAALRRAILALIARFPVYRSYVTAPGADPLDHALWAKALSGLAAETDPWTAAAAEALVRLVETDPAAGEFRTRFQQLTGPAMAKGLEDTELYRAVALTSANEVGGETEDCARAPAEIHAIAEARGAEGRRDLITLATHDTKRGPEVRARLNALSLDSEGFIRRAARWRDLGAALRGPAGPDAADEWLIQQTILGAWPIDADRLRQYLTKALREAKRHSSWEDPNEAYEAATLDYAAALLAHPPFREDLLAYLAEIDPLGRVNALAQMVLALTLPGTPDIYQGTEFWDFSLVDPDNRRPVDYAAREAALEAPTPDRASDAAGIAKLHAVRRLLALRQLAPDLFTGYRPLPAPPGWFAFTRGGDRLLVMVPVRGGGELPAHGLPGEWEEALGLPADWPVLVAVKAG